MKKQCRPVKPLFSALTDDTQENAQTQRLEHTTFVLPLTQLSTRAGRTSTAHYHCPQKEGNPETHASTNIICREFVIYHYELKKGLDEISNVHWHLFDLSAVELFDFSHHAHIFRSNEINSDTFPPKTTTTSDTMDVILTIRWKIIVDN
jgi:hypothetical protein